MIDLLRYLANFSSTFAWLGRPQQCRIPSGQAKFGENNKWKKQGPDLPKKRLFETQTSKCRPR